MVSRLLLSVRVSYTHFMYKISFYVPVSDAETVKDAMFSTGAGNIGAYGRCSWETAGTGQFRPLQGSNPTIGLQGNLERVEELKVEMVCDETHLRNALEALLAAHPYEEPAYGYWKIGTIEDLQ